MELQFFGANCVRLSTKKASLVVDDNLSDLGLKSITKPGDISLFTAAHAASAADTKLTIDQPGEYEVSNVSIRGIAARAHMDEEGQMNATIFKIIDDDIRVVIMGHVHPELEDSQLEALGTVDILFVPVGGSGYTLDGQGALAVIKKVDPKIIIPTHYGDSSIKFPVPQQSLDEAIKTLSLESKEKLPKLKVKSSDISDTTQLIVLERQ